MWTYFMGDNVFGATFFLQSQSLFGSVTFCTNLVLSLFGHRNIDLINNSEAGFNELNIVQSSQ